MAIGKIYFIVPLVAQHRASLQQWISILTSNLLKRLISAVSKNQMTLAMIIKRKKLERHVQEAMQDDLENFEKTVFEDRVLNRIQKYLKAIRKTSAIPPVVKYGD